MRRTVFPRSIIVPVTCIVSILFSFVPAYAQRQSLPEHVAAPTSAKMLGSLPAPQRLNLSFALPLRNQKQLELLLQELHDPSSPRFGKFLTVQQFTEQFGPTALDYDKVVAFAKSHGFTVTRTYANRILVNVSGPVSAINRTFQIALRSYQHPTEARTYFAPDSEASIDSGIPILSVQGLSDFNRPQPMLKHASPQEVAHSDQTGSGQGGQFLGSDMRAAYAPGVALDGTGQSVGLIELGPYNLSDVQNYFSSVGQTLNVPIYNVLLGVDGVCSGTPATGGCDDGEEVIDIEQAISMAPHLSALIVYEAYGSNSDALTAFTQAANDNVAKQLSLSFGWGGTPATEPGYEQIFMELAAQGQNTFVASGDSGASVGTVGYPGNSPNITDAGGTDLTTAGPGGAWQSETGWVGSGGGWNTASPIPAYQTAAINSTNQGSPLYRNIPDVAMEANTDNYFCANGSCSGGIGGTSLAAPRWAGFLALVNQQANGSPVGFLNPTVYSLGKTSAYSSLFHDVTTGNDFNSASPALFAATAGYDLVTGWGSPNGQNMIEALAPSNTGSPNFSMSVTPANILLTPGSDGSATVSVASTNGFNGIVDLAVTVVGQPTGITASLSPTSIVGAGSSTLSITTTAAAPGGTIVVAVTGTSAGLAQTDYLLVGLPTFTTTATPSNLFLDQNDFTTAKIGITDENGFAGKVTLSPLTGLPEGVLGIPFPAKTSTTSTLILAAGSNAFTEAGSPLTLTAQSGNITQTIPSLTLSVSAAKGRYGSGTPVALSSAYNLNAVYSDGKSFTSGGLDGGGSAYSANILTNARVLNGIQFDLGPANTKDAVYGAGQAIKLPRGRYDTLQLLGTGIDGNQLAQPIVVTYADGTTSQFSQSFSDWFSPGPNANEAEAVAMPYRNSATGTKDARPFNLYAYTLLLHPSKVVSSLTLPNNRAVIILAATLANIELGTQADLYTFFNTAGIVTDGTTFPADGGLDGGGAAFSANLLGDQTGPSSLVVHGKRFQLARPNKPNAIYGTGQQIALPEGHYNTLHLVGTGVQGNQTAQPIVVTYSDGSTTKFVQNFSDWFTPQGYERESVAVKMPYRDFNDGSQDDQNFNVYEYSFPLDSRKSVKSVQLPQNRYVLALAITVSNDCLLSGLSGGCVLPMVK